MKNNLKKNQIARNFGRASAKYDDFAILQRQVAQKLCQINAANIKNSQNILDLGCGTGFVSKNILEQFTNRNITQIDVSRQMLAQNPFKTSKINADIENLPLRANIFDLIFASLSFQWLKNLPYSLENIIKTAKKGGILSFATLGDKTLQELKVTGQKCQINLAVNDFYSKKDLEQILQQKNYNFSLQKEEIKMNYSNFYDLLRSIKNIGANASNSQFLNRSQFTKLSNFYLKNFNLENKVFATWQVLYITIYL